ncbi:hypothetical protein [Streptococcus sobrinus]|nr:hypothetical protein [Streptococcus sobrinus]SQG19136.1 Uncharacterised protein [Streptococcus sobrinus]
MSEEILSLQTLPIEEDFEEINEVDGMRGVSTLSGGGCHNWSTFSIGACG